MMPQRRSRRRGVILTHQGFQKLLDAKTASETNENFDKRYSHETLGFRMGLDTDTVAKVFACEVGVDKTTLKYCFRAFNLQLDPDDYQYAKPVMDSQTDNRENHTAKLTVQNCVDWGEAPDVSEFYGRTEELATLKHWILTDRSRLVTLLGMEGMGKTYLSVKLTQQIQHHFEFVIWRSLLPTSPVTDLLADLIPILSNGQETDLPEPLNRQISRLIHYLQRHRCLLVLDGADRILQHCAAPKMTCRDCICLQQPAKGGYCELFKRVAEAIHQSCLILTSRVKSYELIPLEGQTRPVRVFPLQGLQVTDIQKLFGTKGTFSGTAEDWNRLVDSYAGNPLVLNQIATTIQQLFNGNITEFLKQKITVFGSFFNSLDREFEHLPDLAKATIQCMVVSHQPITFSKLRTTIQSSVSSPALLETLELLQARSWIDANAGLLSLQPMIMEYAKSVMVEKKIAKAQPIAFLERERKLLP